MPEKIPYKTKSGETQFRPEFTSEELTEVMGENMGWCLACGEQADGVEPDARKYTCEACDKPKVYGLEELLLMGIVKIGCEAD